MAHVPLVITCEHATREVPAAWRERLAIPERVLASHRGYDRGSLAIAEHLAAATEAPLFVGGISRLVIELNRSDQSPELFSNYSRRLTDAEREELLKQYYRPFRATVRERLEREIAARQRVLHLSVHTFTPVRNGVKREADIGLLFDPSRPGECAFAEAWRDALLRTDPTLRVRMNYPYLGTDDGHTTDLRKHFPDNQYAGLELEVNQSWARGSARRFAKLMEVLAATIPRGSGPRNDE